LAAEYGVTDPQLCLAWLLRRSRSRYDPDMKARPVVLLII
jgi:hypothetical protein